MRQVRLTEDIVRMLYKPPAKILTPKPKPKNAAYLNETHKAVIETKEKVLSLLADNVEGLLLKDIQKVIPKHESYIRHICIMLEREGKLIAEKVFVDSRYCKNFILAGNVKPS